MQLESKPNVIDEKERAQVRLESRLEALRADGNRDVTALEQEVERSRSELEELERRWQEERTVLEELKTIRESVRKQREELEAAELNGDAARAAEIRYGVLKDLEAQVA